MVGKRMIMMMALIAITICIMTSWVVEAEAVNRGMQQTQHRQFVEYNQPQQAPDRGTWVADLSGDIS